MTHYVNQEAFLAWYKSVSRAERVNEAALLNEVFDQYAATGKSRFVLPASKTRSGQPESYDYRFEDLGRCGGSNYFITF